MVRHKNSLVLFGGFYDTGYEVHVPRLPQALWSRAALQVNYFNDLHIFDLDKQVSGLVFLPPIPVHFSLSRRSGAKSATILVGTTGNREPLQTSRGSWTPPRGVVMLLTGLQRVAQPPQWFRHGGVRVSLYESMRV
jgi:hypothetical protein